MAWYDSITSGITDFSKGLAGMFQSPQIPVLNESNFAEVTGGRFGDWASYNAMPMDQKLQMNSFLQQQMGPSVGQTLMGLGTTGYGIYNDIQKNNLMKDAYNYGKYVSDKQLKKADDFTSGLAATGLTNQPTGL